MTQNIDPKLYDKRIYERMIRKGLLTQQEYNIYLQSLPDLTPTEENEEQEEYEEYEEEEEDNEDEKDDKEDTEEDA